MSSIKGHYFQSKICSGYIESDEKEVKKVILISNNLKLKNKYKKESCLIKDFPLPNLIERFKKYFDGEPVTFKFKCDLNNLTRLERDILSIVKKIPYSKTMYYEEIAEKLGNKNLRRAVGRAVSKNPCPIIIPCHRVIGKGGSLTGFSADGGTELKKMLLNLENIL